MKPISVLPPSPSTARSDRPLLSPSSSTYEPKSWPISPTYWPISPTWPLKSPTHLLPHHFPVFLWFRRVLFITTILLSTFSLSRHFNHPLSIKQLHLNQSSCQSSSLKPLQYPSTQLGIRADEVFETIGSLCLDDYISQLNSFLSSAFPLKELDQQNPDSIKSHMNSYLNLNQIQPSQSQDTKKVFPKIPHIIHQTNRENGFVPKSTKTKGLMVWDPESWKTLNPEWDYHLSEDKEERLWVNRILRWEASSLLRAWNSLSNEPVMRADLWRYLKLVIVGGVYSDMDTRCLKPIETWMECHHQDHQAIENRSMNHENQFEKSLANWTYKGDEKPSVIVGIEADVGDRADWEQWWPRPIQLVQWTIAAAPGHPVLIDTLRRLVSTLDLPPASLSNSRLFTEKVAETESERIMRVVKATGPAPFTDSVLRYLGVITKGEVRWNSLRNLPPCGLRIRDVLVLPISGFSPGVKIMGAEEIDYEGAFVHHGFAGTWKSKTQET